MPQWRAARALYEQGDFAEATAGFAALAKRYPAVRLFSLYHGIDFKGHFIRNKKWLVENYKPFCVNLARAETKKEPL